MTVTTLITVNAILAALVVYGIVFMFGHSIRAEVRTVEKQLKATLHRLPERKRDRLAA